MFSLKLSRPGSMGGQSTTVCLFPKRFDVGRVRRVAGDGTKPRVEVLESYERGKDDVDALKRLRKKFSLNNGACTTLLAPADYQLLQIETLSAEDPEERMELLRARVQDMIETPIAHVTLDVFDIPTEAFAPGRQKNSYAVVAGNAVIAPKVQMFHQAGVKLKVIDIPELAQRNIAAFCEQPNRALAFLAFDDTGGLLTFTANGDLFMFRRIEIGLPQLLTDDLDRRSTLFDRIGLEVQRSLDNFDRQFGFIPLARLLIGPQPDAVPLQGFLADHLGMTVDVLDLADILDIEAIPELRDPGRQAQCLQTLGAALRQETAA